MYNINPNRPPCNELIRYRRPPPIPSTTPDPQRYPRHQAPGSPNHGIHTLISRTHATPGRNFQTHTCILSVIVHHSLTFGLARMRSISRSKSVPTYLNVANRVRSLSKKMESTLISISRWRLRFLPKKTFESYSP